MNICAPNRYDSKNQTCFSLDQLIEMTKGYNRFLSKSKLNPNGTDKIKSTGELIDIKPNKPYLLREIKKRFDNVCANDEVCITQQTFMNEIVKEMKDDINNKTFRAVGPENSKEWLSTVDIDNIMSQYEAIYPEFKFLGAVPLNCNDLNFCSLYKMDYDDYNHKGINQLGIIFNMDKYGQPGSHWVALFIDIVNGEIYYSDSNGKPPIENVASIINNFLEYYHNKTGKNAIYQYNKKAYQQDNSECGIYSCNFIIRKLRGETFDEIVKNYLTFKEINSCRNKYFRNKPSEYKIHEKCDPGI